MKMPFDGWVIYDRVNDDWKIISIVSTANSDGYNIKELIKAGLLLKGIDARIFTHSKGDSISWRMKSEA